MLKDSSTSPLAIPGECIKSSKASLSYQWEHEMPRHFHSSYPLMVPGYCAVNDSKQPAGLRTVIGSLSLRGGMFFHDDR